MRLKNVTSVIFHYFLNYNCCYGAVIRRFLLSFIGFCINSPCSSILLQQLYKKGCKLEQILIIFIQRKVQLLEIVL